MDRLHAGLALAQQSPDACKAALLVALALAAWWVVSLLRGAAKWLRVARGCAGLPTAPGCNPLLGHVTSLAPPNCAWEKMYGWMANVPDRIYKVRILHRTGVVVGNPLAIKRIFQVRCGARQRRSPPGWRERSAGCRRPAAAWLRQGPPAGAGPGSRARQAPETPPPPAHTHPRACCRRGRRSTRRTWTSATSPSCPSWAPGWSPPTATTGRRCGC